MYLVWGSRCQALIFNNGIFLPFLLSFLSFCSTPAEPILSFSNRGRKCKRFLSTFLVSFLSFARSRHKLSPPDPDWAHAIPSRPPLADQGKLDDAIIECRRVIEIDPKNENCSRCSGSIIRKTTRNKCRAQAQPQ
jgi:hypothetical protein